MSEDREKQIQQFFDDELSAEELSHFNQESAANELENLSLLREGVRDWYASQAKELEPAYKPGFAARYVMEQTASSKRSDKEKSSWSLFNPSRIGWGALAGAAALALVFILPSADSPKNIQSENIALAKKSSSQPLEKSVVKPQAIACLLYTSPSPRDATLSRMPSSA